MQSQNSKLFREYIQGNRVKFFSEVPINPNVDFHFILAFALDTSTNGDFDISWDKDNLSPDQVSSIKSANENVKVALSLGGGDSGRTFCSPDSHSIDKWVHNAVSSLKKIINPYQLDGIDIDYEHFDAAADSSIFAECIGQLIKILKDTNVISFASIAPFNDTQVQRNYLDLWRKYGQHIDYVNFQFYKYPATTDSALFRGHFDKQSKDYDGGKVLVSFISDGSGGLSPADGFFAACKKLKKDNKLHGIFVWSADLTKVQPSPNPNLNPFHNEIEAQELMADASH